MIPLLRFLECAMGIHHDLLVSVDVGCRQHSVAIGLRDGSILQEFDITHDQQGFREFFTSIEREQSKLDANVLVAMEGYNGYARPLDRMVRARDYRLFNINNMKLARFKEVFPGAAKTDTIDARKGLELFQLQDALPMAKDVLTEVLATPKVNDQLKRLTRRRRRLVNERVSVKNAIQSDLNAICPGMLSMTNRVASVWFLNFLLSAKTDLHELARKRRTTLLGIRGVGKKMVERIVDWQSKAEFSDETLLVTPMILEDARRIAELNRSINDLETQIDTLSAGSESATLLRSLPGFGLTCSAELAGEIGTIERFNNEASLALYLGMAPLDNASGTYRGTKTPRQVNRRAKGSMMAAVEQHRRAVPESKAYYERKRAQGKKHNQAIRALGRHLCRVLFKMLSEQREYEMR